MNNLPKTEKRNSDIATDEPFSQEEIKKLLLGLNTVLFKKGDKNLASNYRPVRERPFNLKGGLWVFSKKIF